MAWLQVAGEHILRVVADEAFDALARRYSAGRRNKAARSALIPSPSASNRNQLGLYGRQPPQNWLRRRISAPFAVASRLAGAATLAASSRAGRRSGQPRAPAVRFGRHIAVRFPSAA